MTVGLRLGDAAGRNGPAGAALIVDDDRLPECVRKLGADGSRDEIGSAAGRNRDDQLDRAVGITLLRARRSRCRNHDGRSGK